MVLYEMLTGTTPFAASAQTDLLVAILSREPAALSRVLPNVSDRLEEVVNRLLFKDQQARYQTADELIHDLEGVRKQAIPSSSKRRMRVPGTLWKRLAVVVIAALVVVAGVFYFRNWEAKRSSTWAADEQRRRVVALLPFENLSHDPEQEYFSEGISEEISGQLFKARLASDDQPECGCAAQKRAQQPAANRAGTGCRKPDYRSCASGGRAGTSERGAR